MAYFALFTEKASPMIQIERFVLSNGLRILVNTDTSTPFVAFNLLYDVGSKDEDPERTGFAHLFEHLMFGGSENIPSFDRPLQMAGGENNAFTNTDITNYYIILPKENIETAFWLESDRMLSLEFSQRSLDVQKQVVIEEFKQRYLNRPYGDTWMLLRPLAYREHPYQWATIGKDISHIESADLDYVKEFFFSHYAPNNAILSLSGNITAAEVRELADKWFAPIAARPISERRLAAEPVQTEARTLTVEREVPYDLLMKSYHICGRRHRDYYASDLLSDILSNGNSSRLYRSLVKENPLFSDLHAFITGEMEEGMFVFNGSLLPGVSMEQAEAALMAEIDKLGEGISRHELDKVVNKLDSTMQFSTTSILNKAMSLAKCELIGDADLINTEIDFYRSAEPEDLMRIARQTFVPSNCSTLYYKSVSK